MKKLFIFLFAAFILFGTSGIAAANVYYSFDFEDPSCQYGPVSGLKNYMEDIFGSDINIDGALWWGHSLAYGSDVIYTKNKSAVFDFDPSPSDASAFKINSVSFEWLVLYPTNGIDFGLDVYDDATHQWIDNIFHVNHVGIISHGETGWITFDDNYQITRLRIHDCGILDVGMDNLRLCTVPIPATLWIFGAGLIGLLGIRRKFRNA